MASVTAPVSTGSVRTRIAASRLDGSCSGRLTRSQNLETGLKQSLTEMSYDRASSSSCSTGLATRVAKMIAGEQEHGQAVHRRERCSGDHVRRTGADRGRARERGHPVLHPREACRGVHHRLLVPNERVGHRVPVDASQLQQRLADTGDVAVPEDAEAAGNEPLLDSVPLAVLAGEERRPAPARRSGGGFVAISLSLPRADVMGQRGSSGHPRPRVRGSRPVAGSSAIAIRRSGAGPAMTLR